MSRRLEQLKAEKEAREAETAARVAEELKSTEKKDTLQMHLVDIIDITPFYTLVIDPNKTSAKLTVNNTDSAALHIASDVWHDTHHALDDKTLKKLFISSKSVKPNIYEQLQNEREVLQNSRLLASGSMFIHGKEKYVWFPLSHLHSVGDSKNDSFDFFLPISSNEKYEKLFNNRGLGEIDFSTKTSIFVDAIKRNSCIASISERIRVGEKFGFYTLSPEQSVFANLDAATTAELSAFELFARDTEPELPPQGGVSVPGGLAPSNDTKSLNVDETEIQECSVTFKDITINFRPVLESGIYKHTDITIERINEQNKKVKKQIKIQKSSVSDIIEVIKEMLALTGEKGKRTTKQASIDEEIKALGTTDISKLKEILSIVLIKTYSDEIQIVKNTKDFVYVTFDGNAAVGVARTEVPHNHCVLLEKGVGALCLRPIKTAYLSCLMTNLDTFARGFDEIRTFLKPTDRESIDKCLNFFYELKLTFLSTKEANIHGLLYKVTDSFRNHNTMLGKIKRTISDAMRMLSKKEAVIKYEDIKSAIVQKYDLSDMELKANAQLEQAGISTVFLPTAAATAPAPSTTIFDDSNKKRYAESGQVEADEQNKSRKIGPALSDIFDSKFTELISTFKTNAAFLESVKSDPEIFLRTAKNNKDLIENAQRELPTKDELNIFLKNLVLITLNLEDEEAYLEYDDEDVAVIISLFDDNKYDQIFGDNNDKQKSSILLSENLKNIGFGEPLAYFGGKNKLKKTKRNYVTTNKKTRRQYL